MKKKIFLGMAFKKKKLETGNRGQGDREQGTGLLKKNCGLGIGTYFL
jgi:hypothetical protein